MGTKRAQPFHGSKFKCCFFNVLVAAIGDCGTTQNSLSFLPRYALVLQHATQFVHDLPHKFLVSVRLLLSADARADDVFVLWLM